MCAVRIAVQCSVCESFVDPDECAHLVGEVRDGYRGALLGEGEFVFCSFECVAIFFHVAPGDLQIQLEPEMPEVEQDSDAQEEEEEEPDVEDSVEADDPDPLPKPKRGKAPQRRQKKTPVRKASPVRKAPPHAPPEDIRYLFEVDAPPSENKPIHGPEVPTHLRDTIPSGQDADPSVRMLEERLRRTLPTPNE